MLETKTRRIGDMEVAVTQFAGRRNLGLLIDLAKTIGPTLTASAEAFKAGSIDDLMGAEIDLSGIAEALFGSLDRENTMRLVHDLLASTSINGRAMDDTLFDSLFAGASLWQLPKVLAFVIEVNFGNFSGLAESVSGVVGQRVARASES